jgi:hypothetical protein
VTGAVALLAGTMVATASAIVASASSAVGAYTTKGAFKFFSAPKLHPPKLLVHTRSKHGLAPGDFLVANLPNGGFRGPMTGEGGPIIYDNQLRPVWVLGNLGTKVGAADLEQQTYLGQPVLTWWEGTTNGQGYPVTGQDFVVDEHYDSVAKLKAKAPWVLSLHDAAISGPNVWVTVYRTTSAHSGHWSGKVADVGVQEYNLKTGKLLYTWDALKGPGQTLPLSASELKPPKHGVWDAYHINSVQPLSGGNILVSMRNTWSVYLINPTTKKILWTLGGKQSTFKSIPKNAQFAWQHDARLTSGSGIGSNETMTVFDDACTYGGTGCHGTSAGMILRLNSVSHKASLVKAYVHKGPVSVETFHAPSMKSGLLGSMQVLPNGNALVDWGDPYPYFTEFSKSGKTLLDAQMPGKDQTYRVLYTQTWVGTPSYPPGGAAKTKSGKTTVYASWNGATEVAKWNVLAGSSSSSLKMVASHSRTGFETAIKLSKSYADYEVQALDSSGHLLGTSKSFS